ncbi:MAG: 1,4-dihydroxy-2-naphthoyl-CoA hydrolase [Candidatus Azotimanducaceae bacterium]|jgi:1,4-dihydroxy-2-naphthoyl-CoA hydrolase
MTRTLDSDLMPFSKLLGVKVTSAEPDCIKAELLVRDDICTTGGIMHGGAIMAMADSMGAIGAYMNIPDTAKATTTIESKTNFMRAAPNRSTVTGECVPLHVGRRTSVWQTTLRNGDGKTIAIITQTQMVL